MASLNSVMIVGRLGRDPETRYTAGGVAVANLNVATDESYKDKQGQKVDKTEWHRIVVFGQPAEFCGKYLAKGRLILIEGSLQTRKWQDQSGQDRYTTEIKAVRVQALEWPDQGQRQPESGQDSAHSGSGVMDDAPF